jgi:general transcription factor 3C polypeptide 3 (transcription factor C subunit 4)
LKAQTSTLRIVFQAAACHRGMGDLEEAAQIYQHSEPLMLRAFLTSLTTFRTVIHGDPDQDDAKMKLAELYEEMNEPKKALSLVYEGNQPHHSARM